MCTSRLFRINVCLYHETILGKICHIKGSKPGSARYDEHQSNEERHSFGNLIALCGKYHDIIDDNEDQYPVALLLRWKATHEESFLKQREIGWLGECRTTIFVEIGNPNFVVEYWFDRNGTPQLYTPEQKACRIATIDFTILLSKVAGVLELIPQIKHASQIPYLIQQAQNLKLDDEGLVSTIYHLLFELQDLKVSELAVAQTQGNIVDNRETFRKLGEELLAARIADPKLKHV